MNTDQLLCVIKENRCLSFVARSIYSVDTLPTTIHTFPSAYICNTEESYLPGRHWIVFWFHDPFQSECFDSFGLLPGQYNGKFEDFLTKTLIRAFTIMYNFKVKTLMFVDIMYYIIC